MNPATVEWWTLGPAHTAALRSRIMELRKKNKKPISPATANRYLTALEERRRYFNNFLFNAMSIGSAIMGKLIFVLGLIQNVVPAPENFINRMRMVD